MLSLVYILHAVAYTIIMNCDRKIIQIPFTALRIADIFFERLSGVNPDNPKPRFASSVNAGRAIIQERTSIIAVYQRVAISGISDSTITLSTGHKITGDNPAKVFAEAKDLFLFVITLRGYEKIDEDDIVLQFMADTWGSAYAESSERHLANLIADELEPEGLLRSHVWCPGQHEIPLENQLPIFDLLKPEEIGCTLRDSLLMQPAKSCSGIIGALQVSSAGIARPCSFCQYADQCTVRDNGGCSVI